VILDVLVGEQVMVIERAEIGKIALIAPSFGGVPGGLNWSAEISE